MKLHTTRGKEDTDGRVYRIYYDVHEWADNELKRYPKTFRTKYKQKWLKVGCGFDIETTTVLDRSYMYHWQFSWNDSILLGRTWSSFGELMDVLQYYLDRHDARIICWIANLSYEFSFIQHRLPIEKVFAKDERHPITCWCGRVQFRDCLFLSGQGGLANLARNYTVTQKAVGDIDHKVIRNSQTKLTDQEEGYCIADVAILSEWSEYCFSRWCNHKGACKIPLTQTGIVRDAIWAEVPDPDKTMASIRAQYPQTSDEYNHMMRWLFRGGYTHANVFHVGDRLSNIIGVDFTSSYPASMLHWTYPVSCFLPCELETDGRYITDPTLTQDCCWMIVRFHGIRSKTMHHIESVHKITDGDGIAADNGRMIRASWIEVSITDLDYLIYTMFYEWDSIEILKAYSATRGRLPDYCLKPLMYCYQRKQSLKAAGLDDTIEYVNAKGQVNSNYGCMVQRLNFDDITWSEEDGWDTAPTQKTYDDMISSQCLLPQWGIWVTAWSRYQLLVVVNRIDPDKRHNSVVYCDTDSIYMINTEENRRIIAEYNQRILSMNSCYPKEFSDIGCFDWIDHGALWEFKTLGAKRYIKYDRKRQKIRVTVAGLRLGSYEGSLLEDEQLCDDEEYIDVECKDADGQPGTKYLSIDALFYDFRNDLILDQTVSMKTTIKYHDKPYTDEILGEQMSELSGCCISDIPFSIKMSEVFMWLVEDEHKGRRKPII